MRHDSPSGPHCGFLKRQRRLTVDQWKIISAAILGDMLDFFDFFLIGDALGIETKGRSIEEIDAALTKSAPSLRQAPAA